MLLTRSTFFSNCTSYILLKKNGNKNSTFKSAIRREKSENSKSQRPDFPLKLTGRLAARYAIAAFAFGFVDAGYSGDWSRIGVISKDDEDLLKAAAFIVVPLCIYLIFSFTKPSED